MTNALQDSPTRAKTFSRSKVIETIRQQYRLMTIQKRVMDECIEKLRVAGNDEHYSRTLTENIAQYRQAQVFIDTWCESFGIGKDEIEPHTSIGA